MAAADHDAGDAGVARCVAALVRALHWTREHDADWDGFVAGFVEGARLHPAARPLQSIGVADFVARMRGLREAGTLASFEQTLLGCRVLRFGNAAVATAACEMLENGSGVTRDVAMFVCVRDADGRWRAASMAWDVERPDQPIGAAFVD